MLSLTRLVLCEQRKVKSLFPLRSRALSNFAVDYEANHIQTTPLQKLVLTAGASLMSLCNPNRADMIATLGETTGEQSLKYIKAKMEASEEGLRILKEKPRVSSKTVDLNWLSTLPDETFGKVYYKFLEKNKVTPDSRSPVQFIDDIELAYVMQRYRECHDFVHALLLQPTNMLGEVLVKWIEGIQTRLPMCVFGGLFGAIRLSPKQRQKYLTTHLPWAIQTGLQSNFLLNVYYEERWEQPLNDLHKELNIVPLHEYLKGRKHQKSDGISNTKST